MTRSGLQKSGLRRRQFLQGVGVSLALPTFASVSTAADFVSPVATTASGAPLRTVFLYTPNGVNVDKWMPKGSGEDFEFGESLRPLEDWKQDLQVITRLEQQNGSAGKDGAGDHARANASFLTSARPFKTAGADIRVGTSIDQVAASHLRTTTRLASLEISCDSSRRSGGCDSGYACAYQFNLSWQSPTTPVPAGDKPEAGLRTIIWWWRNSSTQGFEQIDT